MIEKHISRGNMIKTAILRMGLSLCVLCAMFFVSAGSPAYWAAWVYLAVLVIPMALAFIYLLKTDPALLERRLKTKEKEARQKWIIGLSFLYFFPAFLVPGFDKRFGWSDVSVSVVIGADILVLIGYGICFLALRENRYASRVVEVEKGQECISTGPYSVVRHPMYSGVMLMSLFSPPALGSYWAMIPAVGIIPLLVARIRNEEEVLTRELDGYREYLEKTRYRLVPGLW
jgi:protein-S-isoprenylcysteine O-methyltransferase Ste14